MSSSVATAMTFMWFMTVIQAQPGAPLAITQESRSQT